MRSRIDLIYVGGDFDYDPKSGTDIYGNYFLRSNISLTYIENNDIWRDKISTFEKVPIYISTLWYTRCVCRSLSEYET